MNTIQDVFYKQLEQTKQHVLNQSLEDVGMSPEQMRQTSENIASLSKSVAERETECEELAADLQHLQKVDDGRDSGVRNHRAMSSNGNDDDDTESFQSCRSHVTRERDEFMPRSDAASKEWPPAFVSVQAATEEEGVQGRATKSTVDTTFTNVHKGVTKSANPSAVNDTKASTMDTAIALKVRNPHGSSISDNKNSDKNDEDDTCFMGSDAFGGGDDSAALFFAADDDETDDDDEPFKGFGNGKNTTDEKEDLVLVDSDDETEPARATTAECGANLAHSVSNNSRRSCGKRPRKNSGRNGKGDMETSNPCKKRKIEHGVLRLRAHSTPKTRPQKSPSVRNSNHQKQSPNSILRKKRKENQHDASHPEAHSPTKDIEPFFQPVKKLFKAEKGARFIPDSKTLALIAAYCEKLVIFAADVARTQLCLSSQTPSYSGTRVLEILKDAFPGCKKTLWKKVKKTIELEEKTHQKSGKKKNCTAARIGVKFPPEPIVRIFKTQKANPIKIQTSNGKQCLLNMTAGAKAAIMAFLHFLMLDVINAGGNTDVESFKTIQDMYGLP